MTIVGLISDTHGLLRQSAISALNDCNHIIHAGDIGGPDVIKELSNIAPVTVVRGNTDKTFSSYKLDDFEILEIANRRFFILHNLLDLNINPEIVGIDVIVFGHTHEPEITRNKDILYINPGSAGPKRPNKPITLGRLIILENEIKTEILNLE